jgi:hypothetical protein
MWKEVTDYAKRIAFLTQDMQKNKAEIAKLQEQVQWLIEKMRQANFDSQRDRENAAHEQEKLLLRLEVALLRSERRTLTGKEDATLLLEDTEDIG